MTTERDLFERWYASVTRADDGSKFTPEALKNLRCGLHYGFTRLELNLQWQAWEACARLKAPIGDPAPKEPE